LFVCKCVLYYCHWVSTQLQLTNISYHITSYHITSYHITSYCISYHVISYIISYHIISYHTVCHWISSQDVNVLLVVPFFFSRGFQVGVYFLAVCFRGFSPCVLVDFQGLWAAGLVCSGGRLLSRCSFHFWPG